MRRTATAWTAARMQVRAVRRWQFALAVVWQLVLFLPGGLAFLPSAGPLESRWVAVAPASAGGLQCTRRAGAVSYALMGVRPHARMGLPRPLRAVSTPPAAEHSSPGRSLQELSQLLETRDVELHVREANSMEGDYVAQLRCRVFGQGKEMYRSQRQKMRNSPHYLLAGIYKTTLMVAVVRALTPRARQVCKDVVLADTQELLLQGWISPMEHGQLVEQVELCWDERSELVVGSVDCSVHEMLDQSLTLQRWVYVSSMAVRDDVRQHGIGERLLGLAVSHARNIFGVKKMFLHVEELNEGALRLYQRAGFIRGDVGDAHIKSMDRMLRLVLQVPHAATLYALGLGAGAPASGEHGRHSPDPGSAVPGATKTSSGSTKMHHIAQALAAQQVKKVLEMQERQAAADPATGAATTATGGRQTPPAPSTASTSSTADKPPECLQPSHPVPATVHRAGENTPACSGEEAAGAGALGSARSWHGSRHGSAMTAASTATVDFAAAELADSSWP